MQKFNFCIESIKNDNDEGEIVVDPLKADFTTKNGKVLGCEVVLEETQHQEIQPMIGMTEAKIYTNNSNFQRENWSNHCYPT